MVTAVRLDAPLSLPTPRMDHTLLGLSAYRVTSGDTYVHHHVSVPIREIERHVLSGLCATAEALYREKWKSG